MRDGRCAQVRAACVYLLVKDIALPANDSADRIMRLASMLSTTRAHTLDIG